MYVALYADESVPYREIVRVLNVVNENHFKMVLATRKPDGTTPQPAATEVTPAAAPSQTSAPAGTNKVNLPHQ